MTNNFTEMQLSCAKALMKLPNQMGSASNIAAAIGGKTKQIGVVSAMMALIRKDNVRPFEQSKWIVRMPPKDQYGTAWYALTEAFKLHLGYCLVNGKWQLSKSTAKVHLHDEQFDGHPHSWCGHGDAAAVGSDEFEATAENLRCKLCDKNWFPLGQPEWHYKAAVERMTIQ